MKNIAFEDAYKNLNKAQKEAVDTIDGPVMVVAGPGTGKTQILALRIANILLKTDTGPSGILCLTFTNSGVLAMRERLRTYIGQAVNEVKVSTFHSFAQKLVEKHFELLDFETMPELLDEQAVITLYDDILESNEWQYLRARNNASQYFYDLKSLISLLKRESIEPETFGQTIDQEIKIIENNPASISTRGESKGSFKKDAEKKIQALKRTKESVTFYMMYEKYKKEKSLMDYDDVLSYAFRIITLSEDVRATLLEENLYVLVDEHQDSSGVQNDILRAIWNEAELPNIFVVGDDRQLIYGFGGASISYFENFKHTFGKAHLIMLIENYRSTEKILSTADMLLKSSMAEGALKSNIKGDHDMTLYTCAYERDEILLAGQLFKEKIKSGVPPKECVLLVPKNRQVRQAIRILQDLGLPVSGNQTLSFFDVAETNIILTILKVVANPYDGVALGELLFTRASNVAPLEAHAFMRVTQSRSLSLEDLMVYTPTAQNDLFSDTNSIRVLGKKISNWIGVYHTSGIYTLIQTVGAEYFLNTIKDHTYLVRAVEVIRTYLHLIIAQQEKNPGLTLPYYLAYLDRLQSYNHQIPLAVIGSGEGILVKTLHGSKGLEFEVVHIAHMNEHTLMNGTRRGFTLPESIKHLVEEKDELTAKRELYVAMTRAKHFCTLSYALESELGAPLEVAHILSDIPDTHIVRKSLEESGVIIGSDPTVYIEHKPVAENIGLTELAKIVAREYTSKNVSVTLLNNFFECPWKWYFSSFLQLPTPKTESLFLGSVVHTSIEHILKNKNTDVHNVLDRIITESLDKEFIYDNALRTRIANTASSILSNWIKNYYPHINPSYITERSVSYHDKTMPHLKMYGKIDLTEKYDEGIVITDFKTGSSKTKNIIEKRDEDGRQSSLLRQLAMYSYLLSGQNVSHSQLLFLEEDTKNKSAVYRTHIGDEEVDLLVRDIREYDQALSSGTWLARECHFKPYSGEQKECEYCARVRVLYH